MINKAPNAYGDVRDAFDRALSSPRGIRIVCDSRGAAIRLRTRFNYFRTLDRKASCTIYKPDDPKYDSSPYNVFELRIPPKGTPDDHVIYIERRSVDNLIIEDLPDEPAGPSKLMKNK